LVGEQTFNPARDGKNENSRGGARRVGEGVRRVPGYPCERSCRQNRPGRKHHPDPDGEQFARNALTALGMLPEPAGVNRQATSPE
jgi:hypothetical protein